MIVRYLIAASIIALATGCGNGNDVQVEPNPSSGGFGVTAEEWKAAHGDPIDTEFDEFLDRYQGEGLYIDHREFADQEQMTMLDVTFEQLVDLPTAQAMVADYLPNDAEVIEEYARDLDGAHVVLYHSDWLADAVVAGESSSWFNAEPGSFFVTYGWANNNPSLGWVGRASLGLSHSP